MFTSAFSGFSVKDIKAAKQFYSDILGLEVSEEWMGLQVSLPGGLHVFVYQKDDHQPATYTVLNLVVGNIDSVVDTLAQAGITFERYDNMPHQDEKGVVRALSHDMGPDIAWFKDPSGNIFSVLQNA